MHSIWYQMLKIASVSGAPPQTPMGGGDLRRFPYRLQSIGTSCLLQSLPSVPLMPVYYKALALDLLILSQPFLALNLNTVETVSLISSYTKNCLQNRHHHLQLRNNENSLIPLRPPSNSHALKEHAIFRKSNPSLAPLSHYNCIKILHLSSPSNMEQSSYGHQKFYSPRCLQETSKN